MRAFQYPAVFEAAEEGGFVIKFPDFPEAITQSETLEEGLEQASDALEEAVIGRIHENEELPSPSVQAPGQDLIPVPAQTAFKAALYEGLRTAGMNKVELAMRTGMDEKEVRRLLDPHHASKLPRIEQVLEQVGKHIVVGIQDEKEEMVANARRK